MEEEEGALEEGGEFGETDDDDFNGAAEDEEEVSTRQLLTQPKLTGGAISSGAGERMPCAVHQFARRGASEGIHASALRDQRSCSYISTMTS